MKYTERLVVHKLLASKLRESARQGQTHLDTTQDSYIPDTSGLPHEDDNRPARSPGFPGANGTSIVRKFKLNGRNRRIKLKELNDGMSAGSVAFVV